LEARYTEFRTGLRRLIARARTTGPVGQLLLAFEADIPLPETPLVVSPFVVTAMVKRDGEEHCASYDYRAGTTVTLPASFAPIVRDLLEGQGRERDTAAFLQSDGPADRAYVLRLFAEAGFLAVPERSARTTASVTA
jgi:hypothetical protein